MKIICCFSKIIRKVSGFRGNVTDFYKGRNGQIWLCVNDSSGLRKFNRTTAGAEVVYYRNSTGTDMLFPYADCMAEDSLSKYWIGTKYAGLYFYDSEKQSVLRYMSSPDSVSLKSNSITSLHIDSRNNLWVGTNGGGLSLFDRQAKIFKTFSKADGLEDMTIYNIIEDNAGFLWISTLSGISRFDPTKNEFVHYTNGNGFPLQEMNETSFTRLSDGRIAAGGNNGFTVFDPLKIKSNTFVPPVLITSIRLLQSKTSEAKPNVEKKYINDNEEIHLKYNQSSFIIEYIALNYIFAEKNQYAYKLEGFDSEWNYVGQQKIAIYTNLNSGHYTFRVKASNNDGVWNEKGMALVIIIATPPWRTWWAYSIYFLILTGIFFFLIYFLKLENDVKIKKIEQENMEKVHQLRIRLFTNFSHELRTPLTLILGPMEDLLNRSDLIAHVRNSLTRSKTISNT
jgi:Y_Y_Y domain/Two component regulator propeller